jgi:hypothetical protein
VVVDFTAVRPRHAVCWVLLTVHFLMRQLSTVRV